MFIRLVLRRCLPALVAIGLVQSGLAAATDEIAVLLPQKGRLTQVAQSVRDGLLAAYYQDSQTRTDTPRLRFYDSAEESMPALVATAARQGARLAIGPLEREQVQTLLQAGSLPLTTIALNRSEGSLPNLIQMSLAPEDEISSLVRWMRDRGIQQPHLLAQSGDSAASRFLHLFETAWQPSSTLPLPRHILDSRPKGGIASAVKALGERTKGADALFLASPGLANQVQPALTYYGLHIPLFSLSSAWEPAADTASLQDLEGLGFCGLPWLLDDTRPEQQALYEAQPRPAASHDRLYALGADAWAVAYALPSLQAGHAISLRTGQLQLNEEGHLVRLPTCAEIRHGMATVMFTPSPSDQPGSRR
jgi:outer membrane PBP1 activator LpoA protein